MWWVGDRSGGGDTAAQHRSVVDVAVAHLRYRKKGGRTRFGGALRGRAHTRTSGGMAKLRLPQE
eukprot:351075-Chlamydomonas_euryale.AAC.2